MKYNLLLLLVAMLPSVLLGQQISGRVIDAETSEPVPFAAVYITNVQVGTYTDTNGNFSFDIILPNINEIKVSAEFYQTKLMKISPEDLPLTISLEPTHLDMEDVVVSSPRGGLSRDNVFKIDRISLKDLNTIQSSNLSEAISNINGVQVASTGAGISKPVIRGMQGLRVLTLINGVRLNNQQWGGDHGLGISELGVGAVEVIKGPSSLLYGSDAFGGVIYLIDAPYPNIGKQKLEVNSKFESVNTGTSNSLVYGLSKGNFRFNIGGLYSSYADYQLPNKKYLENSRYTQHGSKFNMSYVKKNWVIHARYLYSFLTTGIPGHTHDSIIDPLEFQSDIQIREREIPYQRNILHMGAVENKFFFNKNELQTLLAFSRNELFEFEDKNTIPALHLQLDNFMANVRFTHVKTDALRFVYGYQGFYQGNTNAPKAEERLIPDYQQLDNGVYGILYLKSGKMDVQVGARMDQRNLWVKSDSLESTYYAPNFSIGFVRSFSRHIYRLNISSGYRAPHVSELLSDGEHHGALRYEIGDRTLRSEYTLQADLDYEFQSEHISIVINPFYNFLFNYIGLMQMDTLIDGLPTFSYYAEDQASLFGADLGIHYHPHFAHFLHIESTYSYVRGHNESGADLSLMPQARLNTLLKFTFEGKWKKRIENLVFQHQYFFRQDQVGVFETPSIDYHLINVGLNGKVGTNHIFRWTLGVKNALNANYINHLSRLKNIQTMDMGRNIYVGLTYEIPSF